MTRQIDLCANEVLESDPGRRVDGILCPICRRRVFSRTAALLRLKTRILVFENGNAYAKCRYCKHDVVVPLVMRDTQFQEVLSVWDEALDGQTR